MDVDLIQYHSSEAELQNHIKDTTTALSAVGLPTTPPNTSNAADIVDELLDHERRKSNLIIYGAPEPAGSTFTERRSNVNIYLSSLLSTEFKIDSVEISKSSHLGKRVEGKTRPLLITLTENKTRSSILRNAKNLRKSSTYQNVFISPDLSPKERESNKLLYQELKHCKQAGEVNLIIRRGKIVPKQTNPNPTPVAMDSSTNDQQ